jgi:hypothetical protein
MVCHIFAIPIRGGEFQWKWRSESGERESARAFDLYYECVEDARAHGAQIDLAAGHRGARGNTLK